MNNKYLCLIALNKRSATFCSSEKNKTLKRSRRGILITIVSFFLIVLLVNALIIANNHNLLSGTYRLYFIADNVNGLMVKDPVIVKGMNVGRVKRVSFLEDGSARIIGLLKIDKDIKIPTGSSVRISHDENLRSRFVEVVTNPGDSFYDDKDTISYINMDLPDNDNLLPMKKKTEEMLESIDTLLQMTELLAKYKKEINDAHVITDERVNEIVTGKIYYRIQILTSIDEISSDDKRFKTLPDVWSYFHNGIYKYTAGITDDYETAMIMKDGLNKNGYPGAFIVTFKNGERISTAKK